MSKLRVHKEMNLMSINMIKENIINVFYGIVEQYNKQNEYKDLIISKQELWELTGFRGKYNSVKIYEIIRELTKSSTYVIRENHKISGSMFVTEIIEDNIKIEVPRTFQKYLFYKRDIDLMYKAKHRKILTINELEYYDKEVKPKSKFLVLLKKADILGIKGKYNKRLYSLLMQFKKTGIYFTTWEKFKEILEIPKSYKTGDVDRYIFTPAKKELLKVGLKITKINKLKKGKSIDRIEILFKMVGENKEVKTEEIKKITQKKESLVFSDFMQERIALSIELAKNKNFIILKDLDKVKTEEDLDTFKKEFNLD